MLEPITREQLADAASAFAPKRKAFLAAHAANHASPETRATYDVSEDALDELMDLLRQTAQTDPDMLAALLAGR